MLNAAGDYSINNYSESALIDMFSIIHDTQFIDANSGKKNFPAIDLISADRKIGIQITSTKELPKVKKSIDRFFGNTVCHDVETLYVYITTSRQSSYSQKAIDQQIANSRSRYSIPASKKFRFDVEKHIIDKASLMRSLDKADTTKLKRIEKALEKQFENIKLKDDLGRYYDILRERFCEVVMNDASGMTLKDIYIEPNFEVYESCITDKKAFNRSNTSFHEHKTPYSVHEFVNGYTDKKKTASDVKQTKCVLILGQPGQGKTSFCKKFVYDYILANRQDQKDIFYVKLKDIANSKALINSPLPVLLDEIKALTKCDLTQQALGKSIIVLDGLDELYMKDGLKLDDIEVLCEKLAREVESERNDDLQIIITSRTNYVELEKLQHNPILVLQLAPLSKEKQLRWIEKYSRFHPETWLTAKKINEFHKEKRFERSYLKELLEQPLLLHMIASLKEAVTKEVSRTQVYNQMFSELIERRYSSDGQTHILQGLNAQDLRKVIRQIAFSIYQTGNGYISKRRLLQNETIKKFLAKFPNSDFRENLKGIMVAFYFQESEKPAEDGYEESKDYVVEFLHKSLEEYMVAEKIVHDTKNYFTSKNSDGEYTVDDARRGLEILNETFSKQISWEIRDYIIELVESLDDSSKEELSRRLSLYLEDYAKHDFIFKYDSATQVGPIQFSANTFLGVWVLLKSVDGKRNYLDNQDVRQKVVDYFIFYSNSDTFASHTDVNFQSFAGTKITGANYLGINGIVSVDFRNTEIFHSVFVGTNIVATAFDDSEIFGTGFHDVTIENSSFRGCEISEMTFENVVFDNVNFSGSFIAAWRFKNVKFKRTNKKHFMNIGLFIEDLAFLLREKVKVDLKSVDVHKLGTSSYRDRYSYDEMIYELRTKYSIDVK